VRPENVYNMDDTGVMLNMLSWIPIRVLTFLGSVKVLVSKDDLRDYRRAGVKRTQVTAISWIPDHVIWVARHWCDGTPVGYIDRTIEIDRILSFLFSLQGSNSIECVSADGTVL
jgi:hypothetical protein